MVMAFMFQSHTNTQHNKKKHGLGHRVYAYQVFFFIIMIITHSQAAAAAAEQ